MVAQVEGLLAVEGDELELFFDGQAIDLSSRIDTDGSTGWTILFGLTRVSAGACGRCS